MCALLSINVQLCAGVPLSTLPPQNRENCSKLAAQVIMGSWAHCSGFSQFRAAAGLTQQILSPGLGPSNVCAPKV